MKQLIKTSIVLAVLSLIFASCDNKAKTCDVAEKSNKTNELVAFDNEHYKHWVWLGPNENDKDEDLAIQYKKYADAGIVGIFFERDSERHFRAAKAVGLQTHRWLWIMNRGDALKEHPEWAAVSRSGKSTATNPPYVDYYRWMCPSNPEVQDFLKKDVQTMLDKDYVDGIHFDYIRYSDVILASNLWDVYGIEQLQELPEYDFCYCDLCKSKFKEKYGKDINEMKYPQTSLSWKEFRYQAVNNIAGELIEIANKHNKPVTAAVFPTPDVAKKLVMQDWTNWKLDAVFPMIYHGFYKEDVQWIGSAVQQGLRGLDGRFPLYAGLYIPDFKNANEVEEGIQYALKNGAGGVSIFGEGNLNDEVLAVLSKYRKK